MKKLFSLSFAAILCASCPIAQPQRTGMPTPPERMNVEKPEPQEAAPPRQRVDSAEMQKEANELARTAQTIPYDLARVRSGVLPKDLIPKLKQIEKLSKRLRSELTL